MPPDPPSRTQEQSIKARKHQLFDSDSVETAPHQSFQECLRTTPAEPLSTPLKALLWTVGTIVILLLVAALVKSGNKTPKTKPARSLAPITVPRIA